MKKPSKGKQLSLLCQAMIGINNEADEKQRIEIIFNAIKNLGFKEKYFISLRTIKIKENTIEFSYARGQKGLIAAPHIRYPFRPGGITEYVLEKKERC